MVQTLERYNLAFTGAGSAFYEPSRLEWIDMADLKSFPVEDPVLAARLRDEAARSFVALNGTGFARCDVRVDGNDTPFWLEINPNCGVYGPKEFGCSADLILLHDPAGHEGFTWQIVTAAMARHAGRRGAAARRPGGMPE